MKMQKWIDVVVTIDEDTFCDAVWATNEKEALIIAYWNWEVATEIEVA
jgi:hypothetical protein